MCSMKNMCWKRPATLLKRETLVKVFSCELCVVFENIIFKSICELLLLHTVLWKIPAICFRTSFLIFCPMKTRIREEKLRKISELKETLLYRKYCSCRSRACHFIKVELHYSFFALQSNLFIADMPYSGHLVTAETFLVEPAKTWPNSHRKTPI